MIRLNILRTYYYVSFLKYKKENILLNNEKGDNYTMEEKKKDLPVFSRNVAANLLLRGFDMYNVRKNTKYPNRSVFYFRDCQEVRDAIDEINSLTKKM